MYVYFSWVYFLSLEDSILISFEPPVIVIFLYEKKLVAMKIPHTPETIILDS